jgi:hypothetical protein
VEEPHEPGLDGSHPVTLQAKMLRLELLNVKADLERELADSFFTARRAASTSIGCQDSVRSLATGLTVSQRRTGHQSCRDLRLTRRG